MFTDDVDTYLKVKQEASGWPDRYKSNKDKIKLNEYYLNEGILLKYNKIIFNSGLRALAKINDEQF